MSHDQNRGNVFYAVMCSAVAALGGLLFGYDIGVIAGAVPFITEHFHLNAHQEGFAVSNILIGCFIGAGLSGPFSDRYGRKRVLILTALFFALSAILSAAAGSYFELIVARVLGGIAVGASMISALYISEIAPTRMRGILVSLNQFAIVIGILIVYFINWIFVDSGPDNWRYMFASETIPAMLFFFSLFFIPESPRWLVKQKKTDSALAVLSKIMGRSEAESEIKTISETIEHEKGSVMELFRRGLRKALIIGVVISIFAQVVGIGAVIYYAPLIFMQAGFPSTSSAFIATIAVGFVNFAFTIVSFMIIDRFGRKPLLYIGLVGMCVAMTVTGIAFVSDISNAYMIVPPILIFVGCYSMSLGPVAWVIVAEIFPTKIRGAAMSISMMVLWIADFAVAQTFPWLMETIEGGTFFIFAGLNVLGFIFVWFMVPETKGKSLEEIELMWVE